MAAPVVHGDDVEVATARVSYRAPLDWPLLLAFFRARAIAGVEVVGDIHGVAGDGRVASAAYRRTFVDDRGAAGLVTVRDDAARGALIVRVTPAIAPALPAIVARVRRMFDVDADPAVFGAHLARDPGLRASLRAHPGLRVAQAFEPFETCARAVVGQQVSIQAATTIMGRLVARFGVRLPLDVPWSSSERADLDARPASVAAPTHAFPTAAVLADANLDGIGMPGARVRTLQAIAAAVRDGALVFDDSRTHDETRAALLAIPGIGPWTSEYVCMRTRGDADAFPAGDLVLRQRLAVDGVLPSERDVRARAERWRPFPAYGAIALWSSQSPPAPVKKATRTPKRPRTGRAP